MIKWNGIHLSISMIILIFPPRGKIRQIVFDPYPYKAALRMKFNHRAKDIFLFGLFTFWTQFVNEYFCRVFTLLIKLNDTNAEGYYAQSVKKWSNFNLRKLPFSSIWSPLVGLSRFFMKLMARLDGVLFQAQTNPTTKLMAGLGSGSFKHGPHKQIQRHQIVMKRIYGQAHQPCLIDSIGLIQALLHEKIIFYGKS